MHGRAITAFGGLLLLILMAAPADLAAQQAPVLPAICDPGSGVSETTRRWCERRQEEGAVLRSEQAPAGAPEVRGPLGGNPLAAATRPDAGSVVPEAVLEDVPTLPRRSTDPDAARRARMRLAAAVELPLERITARVGGLEGRAVGFRTQRDARAGFLVRSADELLRQMTGDAPPDLFQLIEARRSRGPGR